MFGLVPGNHPIYRTDEEIAADVNITWEQIHRLLQKRASVMTTGHGYQEPLGDRDVLSLRLLRAEIEKLQRIVSELPED